MRSSRWRSQPPPPVTVVNEGEATAGGLREAPAPAACIRAIHVLFVTTTAHHDQHLRRATRRRNGETLWFKNLKGSSRSRGVSLAGAPNEWN